MSKNAIFEGLFIFLGVIIAGTAIHIATPVFPIPDQAPQQEFSQCQQ